LSCIDFMAGVEPEPLMIVSSTPLFPA
jgi:hypothetical protein